MANAKSDNYVYSKLKEIKSPAVYNTFGVVTKILRQNQRTFKSYHSTYLITDESLGKHNSFRIDVYHSPSDTINKIDVGWVLRLHQVMVGTSNNRVCGRIFSATNLLVFPPQKTDKQEFYTDAVDLHFTDKTLKRVDELREKSQTKPLSDTGGVAITQSQRVILETSRLKEKKRKASPDIIDQPCPKRRRNDLNLEECSATNFNVYVNLASEKNRIVNPSELSMKTLVPNPLHDSFNKKLREEATIAKNPLGKLTNGDTLSTSSTSKYYTANVMSTHETQAKELLDSCEDKANNPVWQISSETVTVEEASSFASPCKESRGSPKKAKEHVSSSKPLEDNAQTSVPLLRKSTDKRNNDSDLTIDIEVDDQKTKTIPHTTDASTPEAEVTSAHTLSLKSNKKHQSLSSDNAKIASDGVDSANVDRGSFASQNCPGLTCGNEECHQLPVLLSDDDPRLVGFDEKYLETEGIGDIPAAEEDGRSIYSPSRFMSYAGKQEEKRVTSLKGFQWTHHYVNVKIIRIKPSLKVLQNRGPKDLVSGKCPCCGTYTFYSNLKWNIDQSKGVKKPMCPICFEDGVSNYAALEFRMKLTARDAWGTELSFYVMQRDAAKFLGCSLKQYQGNEKCREKVSNYLSEVISSESFLKLYLYRINTPTKAEFRMSVSRLPAMEKNAEVTFQNL